MGKIKKILENELVGGTQTNDVYPVTSTKAVYDENNERLDKILGASQKKLTELAQQVIYDVTANNDGATFDSLSALLSSENLSTLIPSAVRCGGMSIRFLRSSDNKYVFYKLIKNEWSSDIDDWVNSTDIKSDIVDFSVCDEENNRILYVHKGILKTKEFDSSKASIVEEDNNEFSITDKIGNRILAIDQYGSIRTKNFASKKYQKRSVTGKSCFTVLVDVNSPSNGETTAVQDSEDNKLDHGYIILPTNYSNVGEKTRLVIICHGVGASYSDYISDTITPFDVIDVFVNMGYAVMDMYGMPTGVVPDNNEVHYGAPFVLRSYKKGYDYVMQNYNLKEDGVFVVGISMGGLSSFEIVQSGIFPVIAQVGFCPCIDLFKQAFCNNFSSRSQLCKLYNFEGTEPTFTPNKPPTHEEVDYFISNFSKIIGYCPIIKNVVSGDISVIFNHIPTPIEVNNFPTDEEADYETLTASYPCPLLIIHCLNDNVVAYRYSKYFIDMVKRSGGLARLRTYPTGGHGSWDVGASVQMVSMNGEQFNVPGSVYEAYLFINRFN